MEAANTDRHHLRTQLEERLTTVTALLSPTIVAPAPVHADAARAAWVRNTYVFNLTGSPAGTLPVGSTPAGLPVGLQIRSEEHTSELQSLMRISYAVFCLKNK